jgi:hypothetical protein
MASQCVQCPYPSSNPLHLDFTGDVMSARFPGPARECIYQIRVIELVIAIMLYQGS